MRRLAWWPLAVCLAGCASTKPMVPFDARPPTPASRRFSVVGDLQRTGIPERLFLRERNDRERSLVIAEIARERPDLVVLTGDVVFEGTSTSHWSAFEDDTAPLRALGIPVVTAFGNHEYYPFPYVGDRALARKNAEANVFGRFQFSRGKHWYVVPFGEIRFVVLDSNRGAFTHEEWHDQLDWFRTQLDAFDGEEGSDIRGVVVVFHHPPYTNSNLYEEGAIARSDFCPIFASHRKTMAMLNGHVHSYERFAFEKKMYVVSGGGGGPRVRLAQKRFRDEYQGADVRDFHFTTYELTERGLRGVVHGVAKNATAFREMDAFDVPWPD